MSLRAPRPIQRLSPRLLAENPFPPCRALAIGVDALYVFIFPAIPACGGLEGRTSLPSFRTTSRPAILPAPVRETFSFSASQRSRTPHAAGRGVRPYAMSLVPQRARGRSLRTTSPGQKALPRHRLLRRQKLPPLPVNTNATPGSPPALSGLSLSGRRKKRPARTRCLAVPGQKAFSQGQPCSVGAFQFEALYVNPAACRFAAKNAVSPLTFGRTALCCRLAFCLFTGKARQHPQGAVSLIS